MRKLFAVLISLILVAAPAFAAKPKPVPPRMTAAQKASPSGDTRAVIVSADDVFDIATAVAGEGAIEVESAAYGSGWNADDTHAPSQNAVYDQLHLYDTDDDGDIDTIDATLWATKQAYDADIPNVTAFAGTLLDDANAAAALSTIGAQAAMSAASQVEMETGTEAGIRSMSPLRVAQAIAALATGGAGDVESSGDCTAGACGDGSSDGGTYYRLYDGNSHYTQLAAGDSTGNLTFTFPTAVPGGENAIMVMSTGGAISTLASTTYQPTDADLTAIAGITGVQGDVLYFNGSAWVALAVGVSGQFLETQGAAANPRWGNPSGSGDITAVGDVTSGIAFTNGASDGNTANALYFEGATVNDYETLLTAADPTADRTATLPNETGTVVLGPAGFGTDLRLIKTNGTGNLTQVTGISVDASNNITGAASNSVTTFLAVGADPADAGAIRLSNAEYIYAEAAPAGTDISVIGVTSGEIIAIGASGASGVTITPATTITGTLTMATPFTLGATSVTSTGTQLNYLAAATGTTGTTSSNLVFSASPTFTGTPVLPTPFTLGATSVTSTGTQLNYLAAATGTTGTTSTNVVFSTSPTLVTPTLGVATATSINKVAITEPATASTLTIANGKTLTASNTLTLTGTDSSSVAFGTGGTVAYTGATLAQFAATTSAQLYGLLSDETGSASGTPLAVFNQNPTIAGMTGTGAWNLGGASGVTLPTGLTGVLRADSGVVSVDGDVTDIVTAATDSAAGKVELAANAETTTGTATDRAVTPANLAYLFARPFAIGGTTPAAGTFTTLTAGASGFGVDADGDTTVKSLTITKTSGVASDMGLYEANSTDTDTAGFIGPSSLTANTSWRGRLMARPTSDNMAMVYGGTAASGTGTPSDPYIHTGSFVDLDTFALLAGATFTGTVITPASASGGAGFRLPHGSAPSSPTNGDIWTTTAGVYARVNGGTVGPFGSSAADVTGGSASATGEVAAYGDETGKAIGRSYVVFSGPDTSAKTKTISNANDTIAEVGQTNNFSVAQAISAVNAASGSTDALTMSGTLGTFNGSDTFRGAYYNYTNANHAGTGNTAAIIDIAAITGDANSNLYGIRIGALTGTTGAAGEVEHAMSIGAGWDYGINSASPIAATAFLPTSADGGAAGSASLELSDLFLAAGGIIYGENDQANTLTSAATGWTANLEFSARSFIPTAAANASGEIGFASNAFSLYANSEDLTLTASSNTWTFGTGTGVNKIDFGAIGVESSGGFTGALTGNASTATAAAAQAITDNAILTVDQDGAADNDFAKFTAAGIEGRSYAEARQDLGLDTGDSPQFTGVNVGAASDTTITRVSAGVIAVEGSTLATVGHTAQYSATPVIDDPDNFAANFTGDNLYGGTFISNAAGTAALPDPAVGMNFTYVMEGANANIIDPLATGTADTIYMNGLAAAADENITSSTSGAMCVFQYRAANTWMATCTGWAEATPP